MLPLLAQAPGTSDIGLWVLISILVINGLGAAGGLVAIFATRREVESIEKRVALSERQRLEDQKSLQAVAGDLHDKVNKVDREVGGLQTATDLQTQQLARIENSVHRLIERK